MRSALGLSTSACVKRSPLRGVGKTALLLGLCAGVVLAAHEARADDDAVTTALGETIVAPPPSHYEYIQYGVGLLAETVVSPGPICANASNCILGSGGGLVVRVGWRPVDRLYIGGAYEMSKQDPNQLYRLGILQQIRVEGRRYFPTGRTVSPFVLAGLGASGYGDEWSVDTWGVNATLGAGIEVELGGPVLEVSVAYRPVYFQAWEDSSTIQHDAGVAHFIVLEASIEAKDRL
jgi:hypothetical protein